MSESKLANTYFHIDIAGWLNIVSGLFAVAIGFLVLFLLTGIGIAVQEPEATPILSVVGGFVFVFLLLLGLPGIIAGYGLLKRQNWGRVLAVIISVFGLMNVPIGTVIGVYTLVVLLTGDADKAFGSVERKPVLAEGIA